MTVTAAEFSSEDVSPSLKKRLSRRAFLCRAATLSVLPVSLGAYATEIEPFRLHAHDVEIRLPSLPPAFDGLRIIHLTDLHAGPTVPFAYLEQVIQKVNETEADLVLVTGDLVTHVQEWVEPTCRLLATINKRTYVILGNHDYNEFSPVLGAPRIADAIEDALFRTHCTLLRNRAVPLERGNDRMWLVGMEDYYTPLYAPHATFASFKADAPVIVMSHNPDSIAQIAEHRPALMLSGHTHGGQVRLPFIGAPILPIASGYDQGLFDVNGTRLFVSRGVGFLKQIRLNCRPELPRLILRAG